MLRRALICVCALAATAHANPPQVQIRAHTQIVIDHVRLMSEGHAEVIGRLVDKVTGDGISGQTVLLDVLGQAIPLSTQPDGTFMMQIELPPGPQHFDLKFPGSALLDPSDLAQDVDPARAQVTLQITPTEAEGGVDLLVTASADDAPATVPIDLAVGGVNDHDLAHVVHTQSGTPFHLTRKLAGGPGPHRVRASFAGDDAKQGAFAEITIELSSATTTEMTLDNPRVAYEDDVVVHGKVTDEDGKPVGRAAVALTADEHRLAQGATAEDGTFKLKVEAEILGKDDHTLQVQADPPKSYMKTSRSPPAVVTIAPPQPVPVSYTMAAFLATAAAAGGFLLARGKPWKRLKWVRRQQPAGATPDELAADPAGGLVLAKPGLAATLRRAMDEGFSGSVRDTVRSRPVPGAIVHLTLGDEERSVTADENGAFGFELLAPGEWRAAVSASGHVTEKFGVTIPHRGELRGVRVDLVPVRERVFQLYRRAAEPVLPEPRLWGIWSPRQIVDHVRAKRPSPALADLTDHVEEVYFSPRVAAETVLPHTSERVDRAIRERVAKANTV
ncbi:MAG TPA: carboxypeptidase-like regulatory domain-containing protein [Kofleriaceae bacterium]